MQCNAQTTSYFSICHRGSVREVARPGSLALQLLWLALVANLRVRYLNFSNVHVVYSSRALKTIRVQVSLQTVECKVPDDDGLLKLRQATHTAGVLFDSLP